MKIINHNNIEKLYFILVLVITIFVFSTKTRSITVLKTFSFYTLNLIFILYILIYHFIKKKSISIVIDEVVLLFIIYKVYLLFNILFLLTYTDFNLFWTGFREYYITLQYLIFLLLIIKIIKVKDIHFYLYIYLIFSFFISLFGVFQHYDIYTLRLLPEGVASSTFGNKNFFAGSLVMTVPVSIAAFMIQKNFKFKILFLFLSLFFIFSLLITFTRGAYVGLTAVFFVLFLFNSKFLFNNFLFFVKWFIIVVIILALIILGLNLFPQIYNAVTSIFSFSHGTNLMRITTYKSFFRAALQFPVIGSGYGTFQMVLPFFIDPFYSEKGLTHNEDHAHNELVQILGETGIIGTVLYLWVLTVLVILTIKKFNNLKSYKMKVIISSLLAALAGYFVHNLFSIDFRVSAVTIKYYFFLGLILVIIKNFVLKFNFKPNILVIIIFSLLSVFLINRYYNVMVKSQMIKQTTTSYERPDSVFIDAATGQHSERLRNNELIRLYNEVLEANHYYLGARYKLASAYYRNNSYKDALYQYNLLRQYAPRYTQVFFNISINYYSKFLNSNDHTHLNNAIFYQSLATVQNETSNNLRQLSTLYFLKKNYPLSIYLLRRAITHEIFNPSLYNLLAFRQYENKNYYDAINTYLTIIKLSPQKDVNYVESYKNIGVIYWYNLNDRENAVYYFEKYLKLSDNEEEKNRIRRIISG